MFGFFFLVEKEKGALSMDELRAKDGIYYAIASSTMALTGTILVIIDMMITIGN